jgi:hypothetical protein
MPFSHQLLLAFVVFAIVIFITMGPNNIEEIWRCCRPA